MRALRLLLILLTLAVIPLPLLAQTTAEPVEPKTLVTLDNGDKLFEKWEKGAQEIEQRLQSDAVTNQTLSEFRTVLDPQRINARTLAEQAKTQLAPLVAQLEALGPPPEGGASEDAAVAVERTDLNERIASLRAVVSKADLAFTRADRLISTATNAQRTRFTNQLLQRGPAPVDPRHWLSAGRSVVKIAGDVTTESLAEVTQMRRREIWKDAGLAALAALFFAFAMLVFVRRYALRRLRRMIRPHPPGEIDAETEMSAFGGLHAHETLNHARGTGDQLPGPSLGPPPSRVRRLLVGVGVTLTRLLMPVAAIIAARYALEILELLGPTGTVLANGLTAGALIVAVIYALGFAYLAPDMPELRMSGISDEVASRATSYAMTVAVALALNIGIVGAGERLELPQESLAVLNLCTVLLAAWGLWRMAKVWRDPVPAPGAAVEGDDSSREDENWLSSNLILACRRAAYILAIAMPLASVAGYYALSRHILRSGLLSGAVIGIAVILFLVARETMQALHEASAHSPCDKDGKSKDEGIGLFPVLIGFVLSILAIPVLALVWGATTGDLREAWFGLTEGFMVGETRFRPGDLLIAALVFAFGLFMTRLFQAIVRRAVMPRTRLDVGARSSIVSGLGYLGFFIAALAAISIGGIDLTNLAFLGAALGVGIGFGLQNIVNNFVSGIILLIERPIKVDDWIEVSGIHGIVRKVNVRSTEIQTFDRASYIVPNSELISGAVTNYTHDDVMGRVICPVGVAYGTDVRQVERILIEIARAHPMTLRRPPPQVIFQGFGGSSLDFELRAFLRDVMWITVTRSDLNFEIERRFAEEGIEVPFGQTDVTVKNAAEMIELISKTAAHATPRPERPQGDIA